MDNNTFDAFINFKNYEQIARYEKDNIVIDTGTVHDGDQLYETAVGHPEYNEGKLVIVQAYDTQKEAEEGHAFWVGKMTGDDLPDSLTDCCNAKISQLARSMGATVKHPRIPVFSKKEWTDE